MSPFQQALGNAKLAIMILFVMLTGSVLVNIIFAFALAKAPHNITLTVAGLKGTHSVRYGEILPSAAYSFARNTWLSLNTWPSNGITDAPKQIKALEAQGYVSASFLNQYSKILQGLDRQGFVSGYLQESMGVDGGVYLPTKVIKEGDSYLVRLQVQSLFYFNDDQKANDDNASDQVKFNRAVEPLTTHAVKKIIANYTLRVVPYPNKVGMALGSIVSVRIISQHNNFGE